MVILTDFPGVEVVKEVPGPLPDLPEKIWDKILHYATRAENWEIDDNSNLFQPSRPSMNRTRRAILLVDKKFNVRIWSYSSNVSCLTFYVSSQRLGLRHMYSIPHLARNNNVDRFINVIEEHHNLARLVRDLYLPEDVTFQKRKHVLAPLTSLERVTRHFLVLPDIAPFVRSGESVPLQDASQWLAEGTIDSTLFKPFTNLRSLTLFDQYGAIVDAISRDCFPKLEVLDLWGWDLVDKFTSAEYVRTVLPCIR